MQRWTTKAGAWVREDIEKFPISGTSLASFLLSRVGKEHQWIVFDDEELLALTSMANSLIGESSHITEEWLTAKGSYGTPLMRLLTGVIEQTLAKQMFPCPAEVVLIPEHNPVVDPHENTKIAIEMNQRGSFRVGLNPRPEIKEQGAST